MQSLLTDLVFKDLDKEQRTAIWRTAVTLGLVFHVALVHGCLPGVAGFADAETVETIQVTMLEESIIEAQGRFCTSQMNENSEALPFTEQRRRRLAQKWLELKRTPFDIPSCAALGIR
jgi:hypothetical protein